MSFSSDGLKEQTYSMQSCGRRAYYRSGSKARVAGVIELIKTHIDDGCCISKREKGRGVSTRHWQLYLMAIGILGMLFPLCD